MRRLFNKKNILSMILVFFSVLPNNSFADPSDDEQDEAKKEEKKQERAKEPAPNLELRRPPRLDMSRVAGPVCLDSPPPPPRARPACDEFELAISRFASFSLGASGAAFSSPTLADCLIPVARPSLAASSLSYMPFSAVSAVANAAAAFFLGFGQESPAAAGAAGADIAVAVEVPLPPLEMAAPIDVLLAPAAAGERRRVRLLRPRERRCPGARGSGLSSLLSKRHQEDEGEGASPPKKG